MKLSYPKDLLLQFRPIIYAMLSCNFISHVFSNVTVIGLHVFKNATVRKEPLSILPTGKVHSQVCWSYFIMPLSKYL